MLQGLVDWWRGYSEEDMENVKERLSYSESKGIYVTRSEGLALKHLRLKLMRAETQKSSHRPD